MTFIGNEVKIGPISFSTKKIDDLHTCNDDGKKVYLNGHILYSSAEIRLSGELTGDLQRVTMWHEIVHGILEQAGVDDHPETIIRLLGFGLVQIIRDNPELIQWTRESGRE